jgi:hypothetical protein
MKGQFKTFAPILFTFLVFLVLPIFAYTTFAGFKPQIPQEHDGLTGSRTSFFKDIPYPLDAVVIGEDSTATGQTATLETKKTSIEVQEFYESVLLAQGWKIETKDEKDKLAIYEYKKDEAKVMITSSTDQETTVVTISLSKN